MVSVATRPFVIRLRPLSVAAHIVPSRSRDTFNTFRDGACAVASQWQVAYLSVAKIRNPAAQQPRPDAAVRVGHQTGPGAATQLLPRCVFNDFAIDQMGETVVIGSQP